MLDIDDGKSPVPQERLPGPMDPALTVGPAMGQPAQHLVEHALPVVERTAAAEDARYAAHVLRTVA